MAEFVIAFIDEDGHNYLERIVPATQDPDTQEWVPAWPSFSCDIDSASTMQTRGDAERILAIVKQLQREHDRGLLFKPMRGPTHIKEI